MEKRIHGLLSLLLGLCLLAGIMSLSLAESCESHTWSEWMYSGAVAAPSCGEKATQFRHCMFCSETQERTVTVKHQWSPYSVRTEPTCGAAGKERRICGRCKAEEFRDIPATGNHQWGKWKARTAASCTSAGTEERICGACKKTETRSVAPKGHSFGAWKVIKAATCTEAGKEQRVCAKCGAADKRDIAATGHSFGRWTFGGAATCTKAGKEKRVCTKCGMQETRTSAAAKGHDWGEWTVISEPTAERDGEMQHTCSRCSTVATEAIYEEDGILKEGDAGDEVLVLQKMLKDIGLASDTKGTFNKNTADGVLALQKNNDMPVSGVATRPTRELLSRVWQETRGIPLFSAQNTLGGRNGALSGRTVWISNGDGTHTKYSLGRKGVTRECQCELNELSDGTLVYTCPLCHYSYAAIMINGKAYNTALVARTGEWQSNHDGTHSRDVWMLGKAGTVRVRKVREKASCTSDSAPDADHGTYCKECHGYYQYPDHDTVLLSSEPDSLCGWTKEIWYCNDCALQFNKYLETGEHCKNFKITAVTHYPGSWFYTAVCTECGCTMHESDRDALLEQGTVDCMHDRRSAMTGMSGECGDLHKQMICSACGGNYTLIDRTDPDGCPWPLDGFLGYSEENERLLGCLKCGKVYTRIPMSDEEVAANGDICPEHAEFDRMHEFVRDDGKCYEDCFGKHEIWVCKYCGLEDSFTEEGSGHPSTDTLLSNTCGLKKYGCPICGEVFFTEPGDECTIRDTALGMHADETSGEILLSLGCPECGKVWEQIPLSAFDSVKAGEDYYTDPGEPCSSAEGHQWVANGDLHTNCADIEVYETCTLCNAGRTHMIPHGGEHPRTDDLLWSDCEEEGYGCSECGLVIERRETGKTHPSTDTILYTKVEIEDDERITYFILGCPVCQQEISHIASGTIPEDEWSEWTYTGSGSHSRYWTKRPDVVQYEGCSRVNESHTTCDTCGGTYIESGRAFSEHPIEVWDNNEVVCVIPKGEYYTVLENSGSPYVEYKGIRGYIDWKEVQNLTAQYPCTDPAGHDWQPVDMESSVTCTDISTLCRCTHCGATRWIKESTGKKHATTEAVIFRSCAKIMTGCIECGQVIQVQETGSTCETLDSFLGFDETGSYARVGCPVCGYADRDIPLSQLGEDAWSEWVCSGNGTHSRYVKDYPSIVVTEPCYPGDEAETVCGLCGGAYINRSACAATEDIEMFSTPEHMNDGQRASTLIGSIPKGATFYVTSNGDYATVEYDGRIGYISGVYVSFVDEEN